MNYSTKETALVLESWDDLPKNFTGIVTILGVYCWILDGKMHREDGPAFEYLLPGGGRKWFINGNLHREDGPAIEWQSGGKEWFIHGKKHREDGPAVIYSNGERHWYFDGWKYPQEEWFGLLTSEEKEKAVWNMDQW